MIISLICLMFMCLLQSKSSIRTIHYKFLIPEHIRIKCMCNANHSIKVKKKKVNILLIINYYSHDWSNLICYSKGKFKAIEMEQNDFLNFSNMLKDDLVLQMTDKNKTLFGTSFNGLNMTIILPKFLLKNLWIIMKNLNAHRFVTMAS
uniref:Uncharacterized protein n=1 Tax=Schizaphis graminum TaxID=13262 RepID=A0A2S2PM72_SCHGA